MRKINFNRRYLCYFFINPMFDHLLELSWWDNSNKLSNIGFGEEIGNIIYRNKNMLLICSPATIYIYNIVVHSILPLFSVFAYGATGAGKTHTMLGSRDNPGVIYQTMMALYDHIDSMKDTKTCDVAVSYLEVITMKQWIHFALKYACLLEVFLGGRGQIFCSNSVFLSPQNEHFTVHLFLHSIFSQN